jgi:hypothetical protein
MYLVHIYASLSYHLAYIFAYLQPTMAPNASDRSKKRAAAGAEVAELPAKRQQRPTGRLLESQLVLPLLLATQPQPSQRGLTPIDTLLSPTLAPLLPPRLSQRTSPQRNIPLHLMISTRTGGSTSHVGRKSTTTATA